MGSLDIAPEHTPGADFQRLADAVEALSGARDAEGIIEIVRRSARGLCGAQGIAVILRDGDKCHYLAEDSDSPLWAGQRFPASACISGWAMMQGQTAVIPDIYLDARIPHDAYRPTFVKSLIMTPVGEDPAFAAIGAYWGSVRTPPRDEVTVLQALARSTATAFRNVQLYDSLKREAERSERLHQQSAQRLAEREKAEEHLRLVANELNHRVKNTLATIQALAAQTFRSAGSLEQARDAFFGRLQSLARTHELLTEARWEGADLGEIARRTLEAHAGDAEGRYSIEGPAVRLTPQAAASLSMALHELATNAVKHGALSQPGGRVALSWSVHGSPVGQDLRLDWRETGGPPVAAPAAEGFGARLLTRALPADLEGKVELTYAPDGVACLIEAPMAQIRARPESIEFAL